MKNSNNSVMFSVAKRNERVYTILDDIQKQSINKSSFICAAIMEKYDRMRSGDNVMVSPSSASIDPYLIKQLIKEALEEYKIDAVPEKGKKQRQRPVLEETKIPEPVEKEIEANNEEYDENEEVLKDLVSSGMIGVEFDFD